MAGRQDRISSLPDEVICHILSFLPTKNSIATSILSKRWSPLWRSVPALHLEDENPQHNESYLRFIVFVYSFLLLRDVTHPIKSCTIKSPNGTLNHFQNVNKWLRVVFQLGGVEYLHLDFEDIYNLPYKLPIGILNCRTLVVLKLRLLLVNDVSSIQLPSLKIMHLECLYFGRDGYLSELLSGCPNLEDFKATYVSVSYNIHDDRLREFKSLTKLNNTYFSLSHIKFSLDLICNVQYLYLYVYAEVFSDYKHIPTFGNLTHLELHFNSYYSWQLLLEMLKQCPMLQILVLCEMKKEPEYDDEHEQEEEDWVSPESTPECISSKLRECTIYYSESNIGGLQFASYIMGKARVLQIMKFNCLCPPREQFEVKKEISSYKKSSAMCQLLFNFR